MDPESHTPVPRACFVFRSGSSSHTISSRIWGRPWEHRGEALLRIGRRVWQARERILPWPLTKTAS